MTKNKCRKTRPPVFFEFSRLFFLCLCLFVCMVASWFSPSVSEVGRFVISAECSFFSLSWKDIRFLFVCLHFFVCFGADILNFNRRRDRTRITTPLTGRCCQHRYKQIGRSQRACR